MKPTASHHLLDQHHYLGALQPLGERLAYVVTDPADRCVAVLLFLRRQTFLAARLRDRGKAARLPLLLKKVLRADKKTAPGESRGGLCFRTSSTQGLAGQARIAPG